MINKADEIIELFGKHLKGELSDVDIDALNELLGSSGDIRQLFERINTEEEFIGKVIEYYNKTNRIRGEDVQRAFERSLPSHKIISVDKTRRGYFKWMAAASIVLFLSIISYFLFFKNESSNRVENTSVVVNNDVPPGTYRAKLSFDDGRTFILDKADTGEITRQGGVVIINRDGQLTYEVSKAQHSSGDSEVSYSTLSTARGETYPTVLSDGSKVHLNNETQIRYPVIFTGSERKLELKNGEAYFEIAHNASKPFKVILNGAEIEVLGTQFAVSAFPDEAQIKTSLLSGKVKINSIGSGPQILAPGQQANVNKNGSIAIVQNADVQGSIAWVSGLLHFQQADLPSVLRQLARWYDVEVVYTSQVLTGKIQGDIDRNIPLSEVLQNLEQIAKVHLKIEGRKIIVNP